MATNFEFYENKIIDWIGAGNCSGFLIAGIKGVDVKEICAGHACHECRTTLAALLTQEHIESPKLTKRERAFCEAVPAGWIARDENGKLHLFDLVSEPYKQNRGWLKRSVSCNHIRLDGAEFRFIKWEDEKPWSVEDLLKLEVEELAQ